MDMDEENDLCWQGRSTLSLGNREDDSHRNDSGWAGGGNAAAFFFLELAVMTTALVEPEREVKWRSAAGKGVVTLKPQLLRKGLRRAQGIGRMAPLTRFRYMTMRRRDAMGLMKCMRDLANRCG